MVSDWFWPSILVPACVAGWIAFSHLLAYMSGWRSMARLYRSQRPFSEKLMRPWAMSMRWGVNYNGLVAIGTDSIGLYLSVFWLFRAGHPPLYIPLDEVSAIEADSFDVLRISQPLLNRLGIVLGKRRRRSWFTFVKLTFEKCPNTYLVMPLKTAEKLSEAGGFEFQAKAAQPQP